MTRPLLDELRGIGVRMWNDGGRLRFRAPAGVLTDERKAELRERRDEILALLAEGDRLVPDEGARHEPFPLTDVQSAYLLGRGAAFAYGGVACHGYGELHYPDLDPDRMTAAWRAVIDRHDMLRAVVDVDGSQRVLPEVPPFEIPVRDLRGSTPEDGAAAVAANRAELDHRVSTPDRWPLFAVRITRTAAEAVLHVSIDFLVADFLSVQTLLHELHACYERPGEALPPLDITFRDYLMAERRQTADGRHERDREYWLARLDDQPPAPELPVLPMKPEQQPRFSRWETTLDPDTWSAFCRQARDHDVTPSGAVLAAFAETLAAWSRHPRFTLNVTLLNRFPFHEQVNGLIGDFTSVELLAVDATSAPRFSGRAQAAQSRLWEDLDHRSFSGVEVMRELTRRRGADAALFPVVFTSAIGLSEKDTQHDTGRLGYGISQTPQVWLDCQNIERGGGLTSNWDVRDGVFQPGAVDDMFAAYERLLGELAADARAWESTAPVSLPESQRERRRAVNDTTAPEPSGLLHEAVVEQALATPDRIAVSAGGQAMTYGELLARAVGLAEHLIGAGCAPNELVAVRIERGPLQVVGVLGVLLAGAVYAPVDLSQPKTRRDRILDGAGIRRVLVAGADAEADWPAAVAPVAVDRLAPAAPRRMPALAGRDDLAYVIHTSGSTGVPKGVMISHRSALNTVADINSRFGIGDGDRVLGLSQLGFDLSVYDIFGPLAVGGALVIPDPARRADPSHWADLVAEHQVTVWNSVPAQLQMLTDYLEVARTVPLPTLRLAMLSGDWIPVALPDRIRGRLPGLSLVSLGGATEAAIWSIHHPIGEVQEDWVSIPYGRPLANQTFHVLDAALRDRPDWVTGELYIGGVGVAAGYLGDDERTAERFVVREATGERLYRTGDLGRYLPSGDIEFLGREDFQVKIRGHRIELAEVEDALRADAAVAEAAVVVDGDQPLNRRLVAFVTGAPLPPPDGGDRARLAVELGRAATSAGEVELAGVDRERYLRFTRGLDDVALPAMVRALQSSGLFTDGESAHTEEDVLSAADVVPAHRRLVRRWLAALVREGVLGTDEQRRYRLLRPVDAGLVAEAWDRVDAAADPADAELLDYFRTSIDVLPALLRGESEPLALLFPEGKLDRSQALYEHALFNRWGNRAIGAAARALADRRTSPGPLRVLEVGAGGGGSTAAVLDALDGVEIDYLCTDLSRFFLTKAKERFGERPGLRFGVLDLDRDLRAQGLLPNSVDLVIAGDVLHATTDVSAALDRLVDVVAPSGWLLALEMTRDHYQIMTSLELLVRVDEEAADFTDLRRGRDQVFLEREAWLAELTRGGADVRLSVPERDGLLGELGLCLFAARVKADRAAARPEELLPALAGRLPEYMLPNGIVVLDGLPVSDSGKIDRKALRAMVPRRAEATATAEIDAAESDLERVLGAIWAEALGMPAVGRDDNLFQLGGDSLIAAQITGRVLEEVPAAANQFFDELLRRLLERPTVAALAEGLASGPSVTGEPEAPADAAPSPLRELRDPGTPATPWLLVHDTTGTVDGYQELAELLGRKAPVLGLCATTAPGEQDLAAVAVRYARAVADAGIDRVRVLGKGTGAVLAVEVAGALLDTGAETGTLVLLDATRPEGDGTGPWHEPFARHEPGLHAGDLVLIDTGADADREFFAELCLGDLQEVRVTPDELVTRLDEVTG
ncbi:amino acid adenylation domain-containing protein [Amycolatopsis minnesotensis]|uniref:Phenyloxazoline synthase MbtB n=1 Tax=Amycolatopsis minnesotensis TaxID=337894 RepID=A0ABP5C0X7_9PSEU